MTCEGGLQRASRKYLVPPKGLGTAPKHGVAIPALAARRDRRHEEFVPFILRAGGHGGEASGNSFALPHQPIGKVAIGPAVTSQNIAELPIPRVDVVRGYLG